MGTRRVLVSEEEFLALPETNKRIELVDGEVVMAPSPSYWHQELAMRICLALRAWAKRQAEPFTVCHAPLDVRVGNDRIVQPDVFVVANKIPRATKGPVEEVPCLVVEVVSQDRLYDRVTKRLLYAEAGVQELWLVEQAGMIERRTGEGLERCDELDALLETPLLPGFRLQLAELFAE